jgi:hypothetical protein
MDQFSHDQTGLECNHVHDGSDEGLGRNRFGERGSKHNTLVQAEAAAPDVPAKIGRLILWVYSVMMLALFLFFGTSIEASMMVIISAAYTAIYFGVPAILIAREGRSGGRSMADFLSGGIELATGHIAGREAAVQMLLIPVAITTAIVVIGTVAAFIL